MIKQTIRYYLGFEMAFEFAFSFLAAIYVMFLIGRGLNLLEINLVNLAFFTTKALCEVPTGLFADSFGRKLSFVLSCVIVAIGKIVYAFSYSMPGFIAAEMLIAVGVTFASGAFKAWMEDRLRHFGYKESTDHIYAKREYVFHIANISGALLGAYCAEVSVLLPWFASSGLMMLVALAALLLLKEEYRIRPERQPGLQERVGSLVAGMRSCWGHGRGNKVLRFVMIVSFVQMLAVSAPNMQWQPYFAEHWQHKASLGYAWVAIIIALMLGTWISKRMVQRVADERRAILLCQFVAGLGIMTATFFGVPTAMAIFLMHEVARGAMKPLQSAYLQKHIASDYRATLSSVGETGSHIGGAIGLVASGLLAQYASITTAWVCSGVFLIGSVAMLWKRSEE